MTYEALIPDALAEANTDSTRVRAAFDAIFECCKTTGVPGSPEVTVDTALCTLRLSADDKDKVRQLCRWAIHVAPLGPLPLNPDAAIALALRAHLSDGDD
ncbi:hypothetical protein BZM26_25860 [Paraburkholderia strydomiana]|nr:hypothetical protein BZM26_25860 [Paraburkholderia strydomiana]